MTVQDRATQRAPFDPELVAAASGMLGDSPAPPLSADTLPEARRMMADMNPTCAEAIGDRDIGWEDRVIPGPAGGPDLTVTILRPDSARGDAPGFFNIHGGGMMLGDRFMDLTRLVGLIDEFGFVAVSVDYRLAPENPHPAPVEDCYAGLTWMVDNADSLGLAKSKVIVGGGSAGGGLSAGVSLLARDRGGPALAGQLLLCPMIDDHNDSISTVQYGDLGMWTRASNALGWRCLLGDDAGGDDVSPYAAPSRAPDVSGLPPAFVEVGAAEIFRQEDVEYCSRLWEAGVNTELHVWAGAYHGFDLFAPTSEVTAAALAARSSWIRRTLRDPERPDAAGGAQ